ncbi:hypothetical protein ABNE30_00380 [Paenibacillus larvae]
MTQRKYGDSTNFQSDGLIFNHDYSFIDKVIVLNPYYVYSQEWLLQ